MKRFTPKGKLDGTGDWHILDKEGKVLGGPYSTRAQAKGEAWSWPGARVQRMTAADLNKGAKKNEKERLRSHI